jgi:hypothetical protein
LEGSNATNYTSPARGLIIGLLEPAFLSGFAYEESTNRSAPAGCSPSMAVCANDVALRDLVENFLPIPACKLVCDLEQLVSEMVELENERIRLAAVDTRMSLEVFE